MSTSDVIVFAVVLPLIVLAGWVQSFLVWRRHADISAGVSWFTGEESAAGFNSFILPVTIAFTSAWAGIWLRELGPAGSNVFVMGTWLLGLSFPFLTLSFWLWLFAWPRSLVPPHLRGQPGWIVALWRQRRRTRRERKRDREQRRSDAGQHAARDHHA